MEDEEYLEAHVHKATEYVVCLWPLVVKLCVKMALISWIQIILNKYIQLYIIYKWFSVRMSKININLVLTHLVWRNGKLSANCRENQSEYLSNSTRFRALQHCWTWAAKSCMQYGSVSSVWWKSCVYYLWQLERRT